MNEQVALLWIIYIVISSAVILYLNFDQGEEDEQDSERETD